MEMYRWEEHNGNGYLNHHHLKVSVYDGNMVPTDDSTMIMYSSSSPPFSSSSSSSSSPHSTHGYFEHTISKLDTLAGIAIKYGLEVADIKKMNSLITDHQMFALKTLRIPLPGRHPPSPCLSNGSSGNGHGNSDHSLHDHTCRELFESFLSPKMKSSGQKLSKVTSLGYYGSIPTMKKSMSVFEMAMYRKGASNSSENGSHSPMSARTPSHHEKSRSSEILKNIMESYDVVEAREGESNQWNDTPEKLLAPRDKSSSGRFSSSRTGKSLALRQKSGSRTASITDSESSSLNPLLVRLGSVFAFDGPSGVRKSSSTSCLQDQDNNGISSIWPAFSATGNAKPIFDGLANKSRTGRRNKAALD